MSARLALALAVVIALPAAAAAQDAAPRAAIAPPRSAPPPQPAPAAPPAPAPPPLASLAAAPADTAQCRIGCAQTEYFCRAGDQPDACAGAWSQCVAACDLPSLAQGVPTGVSAGAAMGVSTAP